MTPFEAPTPDTLQNPLEAQSNRPAKGIFGKPPPKISTLALSKLLLEWFRGADWPQERPVYYTNFVAVRFAAEGDTLYVQDKYGNGRSADNLVLVARRAPTPWVAPQSPPTGGAAASYGRAHCRAVLGGYAIAGEGPLLGGEALSKLYRNE